MEDEELLAAVNEQVAELADRQSSVVARPPQGRSR
jgi:hypothetical protein